MIEDGKEHSDYNRIWQNCHYIIIETVRRHLAGKSCKGAAIIIVLVLLKPCLCSWEDGILLAGSLVFKCCVKHCQLCMLVMSLLTFVCCPSVASL